MWHGLLFKTELNLYILRILTTSLEIKTRVLPGHRGIRIGTHWPSPRLGCENVASLFFHGIISENLLIKKIKSNQRSECFRLRLKASLGPQRIVMSWPALFFFLISPWNDCLFRKFTCHQGGGLDGGELEWWDSGSRKVSLRSSCPSLSLNKWENRGAWDEMAFPNHSWWQTGKFRTYC